jgi:hypothetical protein
VLDVCRQHLDRDHVDTPELCSNKRVEAILFTQNIEMVWKPIVHATGPQQK